MTHTPQFVFDKNRFVRAIDLVCDFNRALFDCIAGIKSENVKDKMAFQDVEAVVHDTKKFTGLWKSKYDAQVIEDKIYLNQLIFFIRKNPNSPQAKAFVDLWNAIYLLFPHKSRPLDSVAAFKVFADLPNILPDTKAQYHVLHAFAYNAGLTKESDIKRALTVIANNEHSSVADLKELLNVRNDKDEEIARAIIAKSEKKLEMLQNLPVSERDNRLSDDTDGLTRYESAIKNACMDGLYAVRILINLNPKVAIDAKLKFEQIMGEIGRKKEVVDLKPGEKMPDINDLSQFPHYAKLLKQVKEQEK